VRTAWERLAFGECSRGAAFPRPHADVLPIERRAQFPQELASRSRERSERSAKVGEIEEAAGTAGQRLVKRKVGLPTEARNSLSRSPFALRATADNLRLITREGWWRRRESGLTGLFEQAVFANFLRKTIA
jgi:hypothetical protein